jgi:hypothetical protein
MRALARALGWLLLPVLAGFLTVSSPAGAHPGGLDASGCHTNRKTEDCHCHRAARAPAPSTPAPKVPNPDVAPSGVVKKSRTGICHAPGTRYYAQTQRFTAYKSIEARLASGGRFPKG